MGERKTLLNQFRSTLTYTKTRGFVTGIKTEHVVFIPSVMVQEAGIETKEFIKYAREINTTSNWNCKVTANREVHGDVHGIEFIFEFSVDTDFEAIIEGINQIR